jgi:hypothetical protein
MSVLMKSYLMATHDREIPFPNQLNIIHHVKALARAARKSAMKPRMAKNQSVGTLDMGVVLMTGLCICPLNTI